MKKNKDTKIHFPRFRTIGRIAVISLPPFIVLFLLTISGHISIWGALALFLIIISITSQITTAVFRELENFTNYLKKLGQGLEIDPPHFHRGLFGSFNLADAFQSVKNRWSFQTLSDTRILETLPIPLLMLDDKNMIVFANQVAISVFHLPPLPHKISPCFPTFPFKKISQTSKTKKSISFEWTDKIGQTFQVRIDALPFPTRKGATTVLLMNDITPFKRFKEQQSEFFANASHELKTPLSIVSGIIETLQGPAKDDPQIQSEFLSLMSEQTSRMTKLVQDLLHLSRLQTDNSVTDRQKVSVTDILQDLTDSLQIKANQSQKTIRLQSKQLPLIFGNADLLRHTFQNLLDNAIKYSDSKTVITITATHTKTNVCISIHNKGPIIPTKHLSKLFDRFYRVNSAKTRQTEGTGLGLSIAQQIISKHNGTISVTSTPSDGTTFSVLLPIKKQTK